MITMRGRKAIIVFAVAFLVLGSNVHAIMNQTYSETNYFAPLLEANDEDRIAGQYLVTLSDGYDLAAHFDYIGQYLRENPHTDWKWEWYWSASTYFVTGLTNDSLYYIRRDPGVEEVMENYVIVMEGLCTVDSPC